MKFTTKQYALSLYQALTESHPKDHDLIIDNCIKILKANDDLKHYETIVAEVEKNFQNDSETSKVNVTTAHEKVFDEKLLKQLNEYSKKQVTVESKIDPDLLGGVIIRIDDTQIDASLKTQLDNLRQGLKTS